MAYDENSKKSIDKYRKTQSFLQIRVDPEEKNNIAQHAKECGESVNAFITRAINETIKRDINRKKRQQLRDQNLTKEDSLKEKNT